MAAVVPAAGTDSVIMEDMLSRLEYVMHVRVASLAPSLSAMPKLRLAILGSILYAYDASWKVESLPLLIGRPASDFAEEHLVGLGLAQEEGVEAGANSKLEKTDLANIRRWLNLMGVGHLVSKGTAIEDGKKFAHLVIALLDKAEVTKGEKFKANVRHIAQKQARMNLKPVPAKPVTIQDRSSKAFTITETAVSAESNSLASSAPDSETTTSKLSSLTNRLVRSSIMTSRRDHDDPERPRKKVTLNEKENKEDDLRLRYSSSEDEGEDLSQQLPPITGRQLARTPVKPSQVRVSPEKQPVEKESACSRRLSFLNEKELFPGFVPSPSLSASSRKEREQRASKKHLEESPSELRLSSAKKTRETVSEREDDKPISVPLSTPLIVVSTTTPTAPSPSAHADAVKTPVTAAMPASNWIPCGGQLPRTPFEVQARVSHEPPELTLPKGKYIDKSTLAERDASIHLGNPSSGERRRTRSPRGNEKPDRSEVAEGELNSTPKSVPKPIHITKGVKIKSPAPSPAAIRSPNEAPGERKTRKAATQPRAQKPLHVVANAGGSEKTGSKPLPKAGAESKALGRELEKPQQKEGKSVPEARASSPLEDRVTISVPSKKSVLTRDISKKTGNVIEKDQEGDKDGKPNSTFTISSNSFYSKSKIEERVEAAINPSPKPNATLVQKKRMNVTFDAVSVQASKRESNLGISSDRKAEQQSRGDPDGKRVQGAAVEKPTPSPLPSSSSQVKPVVVPPRTGGRSTRSTRTGASKNVAESPAVRLAAAKRSSIAKPTDVKAADDSKASSSVRSSRASAGQRSGAVLASSPAGDPRASSVASSGRRALPKATKATKSNLKAVLEEASGGAASARAASDRSEGALNRGDLNGKSAVESKRPEKTEKEDSLQPRKSTPDSNQSNAAKSRVTRSSRSSTVVSSQVVAAAATTTATAKVEQSKTSKLPRGKTAKSTPEAEPEKHGASPPKRSRLAAKFKDLADIEESVQSLPVVAGSGPRLHDDIYSTPAIMAAAIIKTRGRPKLNRPLQDEFYKSPEKKKKSDTGHVPDKAVIEVQKRETRQRRVVK